MNASERGALLREERKRQGLSYFRVGVKTGIHPNTVRLAERGAASEATMVRIEEGLGIAVHAAIGSKP